MKFPSYTAPFVIPKHDRDRLEDLLKSGEYPGLFCIRFRIVLLFGHGASAKDIGARLNLGSSAVYRWRTAYLRDGVPGLLKPMRLKLDAQPMPPPSCTAKFPLPKRDRDHLKKLIQSATYSSRIASRFVIVLQSGEGVKASEIANRLGIAIPSVYRWRAIYLRYGVPGLLIAQPLKRHGKIETKVPSA